ncbi:MAG: membrane integrity-associated transporter subunit PqiC [Rhodocyclaceae bacterium]|nr:membrane integrity-associated transporter subunit PqiC [Rhodocyclaceae bacterium]
MRKLSIALVTAALAAACANPAARRPDAARFDLGPVRAGPPMASVTAVIVDAPSWLAGAAMQYRLAYSDPARRREFAESRWAAPPAELIGQALERRLVGGSGRCRLHIDIDEFVQVFDAPERSALVLAGRAALLVGADVVDRRDFVVARPAPTADARGGVAAAAEAVSALNEDLAPWLARGQRCR